MKHIRLKIENFIAKCVYKGIQNYINDHRFALNNMVEIMPLQEEQFKKHLYKVFQNNQEAVNNYLSETAPTTQPHLEQ